MSHFTTLKTALVDTETLVKALADLGYDQVEVHDKARHLRGYLGDWRRQTAEVIIRRKYIGGASNDIGFKRRKNGHFDALISAYDRRRHNPAWLGKLTQRYAYHTARDKLAEQGFDLISEKNEAGGRIRLVLRRMA